MGLVSSILERAIPNSDGHPMLSLADSRVMADQYHVHVFHVEKCALENGVVPKRYARNIGVLGLQGQLNLLCSSVAVVGCGGLGGVVAEILTRAGTGRIILVDGDSFTEDNLNRQIMSSESVIGRAKVHVALERISEINSAVTAVPCFTMLDDANLQGILAGADIAVDALDNNHSRKILYSGCREMGIPVVHGAVGGVTGQCALYKPGDRTHLDLFGSVEISDKGVEAIAGVPSFSPFLLASFQAAMVVNVLTDNGRGMENRLFLLDMWSFHSEMLDLSPPFEGRQE